MIVCRICNRTFNNLSYLRKHQWRAHRENYKNVGKQLKAIKENNETPQLTVSDLIIDLIAKRDYLASIVKFLEMRLSEWKA